MEQIKWAANRMPKGDDRELSVMALENVAKARRFHQSFPQYSVTPLARLDRMAAQLGLGGFFVKDESYRFGLNAFKVLGGSFAMARYIAGELGRDVSEMTYDYLTCGRNSGRRPSSLRPTATTGGASRGRPTSSGRRLWSICRRGAPKPASTTSPERARR